MVMLDLSKIKEDFSSMVLEAQPWTLAQFVMWLDLKLSEYKIKGYMVLDYQKKTKPRWLSHLGDDSDEASDTAPLLPPCKNACCQKTTNSRNIKSNQQSYDDPDFNIPEHNKCVVDLSKEISHHSEPPKEQSHSKETRGGSVQSESKKHMLEQSNSEIIDVDLISSDHMKSQRPSVSQTIQPPQKRANIVPSSKRQNLFNLSSSPKRQNTQNSSSISLHSPGSSSQGSQSPHFVSNEKRHQYMSQTVSSPASHSDKRPTPPTAQAVQSAVSSVFNQSQTFSSTFGQQRSSHPGDITLPHQTENVSGPVPVALHANLDNGSQKLISSDQIDPGPSPGTSVDIKQEYDLSNVQVMPGFGDELNQSISVSDSSHMSMSDDETGNVFAGNRTFISPPNRLQMTEAAKHVELPTFDDPLVMRVLEDNAPPSRHMWSKIITRCAYHMLSKGVPHKHDYQLFSEAFYHRYPCIGTTRGPNPWSYMAAAVSMKVRNCRRKEKKSFIPHKPQLETSIATGSSTDIEMGNNDYTSCQLFNTQLSNSSENIGTNNPNLNSQMTL